jgi:N6-adenosine-specific RNA methylase IME4
MTGGQLDLGLDVQAPAAPDGIRLLLGDVSEALELAEGVGLVHADPPWLYRTAVARDTGGDEADLAVVPYACASMCEIAATIEAAFEVAASDCYLLVWSTWPTLHDWLVESSGLSWQYISGGAWLKYRRIGVEVDLGAPGIGYHWRGDVEPILLYRKGRPKPLGMVRNGHVDFEHELVVVEPRGRHSEKPVAFLQRLVEAFSAPDAEVFDLYSGLAPLARACRRTGRRYLGAEIDPERHAAALSLLAQDFR